MKILFVAKGSEKIGLGHIVRSTTLASQAVRLGHKVTYIGIGSSVIKNLIQNIRFNFIFLSLESDLLSLSLSEYDVIIFDMLQLEDNSYSFLCNYASARVSISPIFNQNNKVELFFNRTKYIDSSLENIKAKKYCGLEYTIIKQNCERIDSDIYIKNLQNKNMNIAISMGGGDAQNKTLQFLKQVKNITFPVTLWVLLGEGYKHSYDQLASEINIDYQHEVILAKTNRSMWQIVKNCALIILPGGITTYEAAYCGTPSINYLYNSSSSYLIQELVENNVCLNAGLIADDNIKNIPDLLMDLHINRQKLINMHKNSISLVADNGSQRILEKLSEFISSY